LALRTWRWRCAYVPSYLRACKRLDRNDSELVDVSRQPPLRLFRDYDITGMDHNVLVLKTTDDERIALRFGARVPGHKHEIRSVSVDFSYRDFGEPEHSAHEHLLLDVTRGVPASLPRPA